MTERALAEVYEVRHYAHSHVRAACGSTRVGLFTTERTHVTCRACLAALGPQGHYAPPRPTLGECAVRELAELRAALKKMANRWRRNSFKLAPRDGVYYRRCAAELRALLEPGPAEGDGA